jgi:hypothetical protein
MRHCINDKDLNISMLRSSLVDKVIEISNLDLVKGLVEIATLFEVTG